MKLFLDECVIPRFSALLVGHECTTSREAGWLTLPDDEVILRAKGRFDVIITSDRRFARQANLTPEGPAVVILRARHNSMSHLSVLVPRLLEQLRDVRRGAVYVIDGRG